MRDLQFLIQYSKIKYGIADKNIEELCEELEKKGDISEEERKGILEAVRFIFLLRNEIHFNLKRGEDLLTEKLQDELVYLVKDDKSVLTLYRKHALAILKVVKRIKMKLRREVEQKKGPDWASRLKQIENGQLSKTKQEELVASENDRSILLAIAWHSHFDNVLELIRERMEREGSYDWNILFALAHSPYTSGYTFKRLMELKASGSPYRKIPLEVVRNVMVPDWLLRQVVASADFSEDLKRAASSTLQRKVSLRIGDDSKISEVITKQGQIYRVIGMDV